MMTDKKYACAMTQLDIQGVLHPDPNMFSHEDLYQAETNTVIVIMTHDSVFTQVCYEGIGIQGLFGSQERYEVDEPKEHLHSYAQA